jgi:hypothetical protein
MFLGIFDQQGKSKKEIRSHIISFRVSFKHSRDRHRETADDGSRRHQPMHLIHPTAQKDWNPQRPREEAGICRCQVCTNRVKLLRPQVHPSIHCNNHHNRTPILRKKPRLETIILCMYRVASPPSNRQHEQDTTRSTRRHPVYPPAQRAYDPVRR